MTQEQTSTTTLTLNIDSTDDEPIYLAGNFNAWNADDLRFKLRAQGNGQHTIDLPITEKTTFPIEYKYHRGGWQNVELTKYGHRAPNRVIPSYTPTIIQDQVPHWRKNGSHYQADYLPQIQILSDDFEMPQLIRTRRISALLPHNYDQNDKHYPVLYLQDGQNLFDDYAPFGNWGVDKTMAVLAEQGIGDVIIVAIDHAAEQRISEYNPSPNSKIGPGVGKKYARFLADTLKPYVDKNFRTLSGRSHTGIGGSSMGGLISIYAGLIYPEVFGKLLIFSPSLWVAPNIHFNAMQFYGTYDMDIYLYAGAKEGASMIPNVQRFKKAIEQQGLHENKIEFNLAIDPEGQHNEARWGVEFPKAIEWLYYQS